MDGSKYWPEVERSLEELNESARTALAIGPQLRPREAVLFPWPSWAPAPGSWVRQAHEYLNGRRARSETWHIAGPDLFEYEANDYRLRPLCGRRIRISPDGTGGLPRWTFDVRGEPSDRDKECWHCRRTLERIDVIDDGALVRPWGDLGVDLSRRTNAYALDS